MPTDLRTIRTFKELTRYLEDNLEWPLDEYGFEDLTFEFDPDKDLGLREEETARIKAIHQLRPLRDGQPWGIFFVEFERKRLPIVVLRKILSHLVIKKRPSATRANRAAWHADDLLFITTFGDPSADEREITFAHFHQEPGTDDMPVLRVLGWDGADAPLKLNYVERVLRDRLKWPEDDRDGVAWREQWSGAFKYRPQQIIRTTKELATALAALAKEIRANALAVLARETENGPLRKELLAFKKALIHDLTEEGFADMYAQTITYGLFTAANARTAPDDAAVPDERTAVSAADLPEMVPVTNPFLREVLHRFLTIGGRRGMFNFDELGIQNVVDLLNDPKTDLPAVKRDFNNRSRGEDPVIHFYESFLTAYNKKLKFERGVFYTPQPVVSCIVRSAHELLQREFGLEDGLADTTTWGQMRKKHPALKLPPLTDDPEESRTISPDEPFVQILDPATGTATFLVEVIDVIHRTLAKKWKQQGLSEAQQRTAWNDYVPKHLLPRLHAFELMMAPYAIAHMKIGLKLAETGYRFGTEERARIYLTNAIEPWVKQLPLIGFDALAHEAAAVNEIKRYKRFTVVIGNPPYSMKPYNKNSFIDGLMRTYKKGLELEKERRIGIIDDDYVRFMRYARWQLSLSGRVGVFGFITKNNYLEMAVSRGIRHELVSGGAKVRIINLHGELKKDAAKRLIEDENVFDIRTSVAISIVANAPDHPKDFADVAYADLLGSRAHKYQKLSTISPFDSDWVIVHPKPLLFSFYPSAPNSSEYSRFIPMSDIFTLIGSGVKTHKDDLVTDLDRQTLATRIREFLDENSTDDEIKKKFAIKDTNNWTVRASRRNNRFCSEVIHPYHFKPFDFRYIYYADRIVARTGRKIVGQMIPENLGLCLKRRNKKQGYHDVFVSSSLVDINMLEGQTYVCPLFLFGDKNAMLPLGAEHIGRRVNLKNEFRNRLGDLLGFAPQPEEIFTYIYAILHSPKYRATYGEQLRTDFPRIPLTSNRQMFQGLVRLGKDLTALHLLKSSIAQPIHELIDGGHRQVETVSWSRAVVWIDNALTTGFSGVSKEVWNFHIGGYQVCEKWLKDRKGRTLSKDDIAHYHKIIVALSETIRLMAEIDNVIDQHGGWPGAFAPRP
jgi:hypothetical protein